MAFMMKVTVSGASGLTNAYRSVRSAYGSPAIAGASRWLDAAVNGALASVPASRPAEAARPPRKARGRFTVVWSLSLESQRLGSGRPPPRARRAWPVRGALRRLGRAWLLSRPCPHASYARGLELDQWRVAILVALEPTASDVDPDRGP